MHDISQTLVQLPRPFERRPVPEGRKFRRWRQPERLFERAKRASCAEGSDRRIFQAGVMGRLPFLLLRFLSVRHGKKMKGPWNRIPETEIVVCFGHVRRQNCKLYRQLRKFAKSVMINDKGDDAHEMVNENFSCIAAYGAHAILGSFG